MTGTEPRRKRVSQLEMTLSTPQSKSSLRMRWAILACTCIAQMGVYYSIDIPAALHQQLKDYMPANSNFEYNFNLLYTLYSLPNIVLPFFGGNLVDRFSATKCLIVFFFLTLLGQFIFYIGVSLKSWNWMLMGRLVYGFGGENMGVAISALVAVWFAGKELAFSYGIGLAIARLGSVFNNIISPKVANSSSVPMSVFLGVGINTVSFLVSIILFYIDRKGSRKCQRVNSATSRLTESLLEDRNGGIDDDDYYSSASVSVESKIKESKDSISLRDIRKFGLLFWLLALSCVVVYGCVIPFNNVASGILLERNYFTETESSCTLTHPNQCTAGTLQNSTNYAYDKDGDICPLNSRMAPTIPQSINITNVYNPSWDHDQYVFTNLVPGNIDCNDPFWSDSCTKDYCDALKAATETASRFMSIPYFISAVLSPPLGNLVDKIGRRAIFASLAPMVLLIVHMTLALSKDSPLLPLIGQGVAYSLFASVIWPSVPLAVEERLTGTAFGVITAIQNLGLTLFPLIVASLYKSSDGNYIPSVEFFFATCAFLGVMVGVCLNIVDIRTGGRLNSATSNSTNESVTESMVDEELSRGYIATLVPAADSNYFQ